MILRNFIIRYSVFENGEGSGAVVISFCVYQGSSMKNCISPSPFSILVLESSIVNKRNELPYKHNLSRLMSFSSNMS